MRGFYMGTDRTTLSYNIPGGDDMKKRKNCLIEYIAVLVIGILTALLLPVWLCFSVIVGLLVLVCLLL